MLDDPAYSPGNLCVYEFQLSQDASQGDQLRIDIDLLSNTDIYWAEGISLSIASGRYVRSPHGAKFFVRYPNNLYLTLVNTDVEPTPYEQIKITYWHEIVENPQ